MDEVRRLGRDSIFADGQMSAFSPRWDGVDPIVPEHIVVLASHPGDEVFGASGIMTWCRDRGSSVEVVAVTDGETRRSLAREGSPGAAAMSSRQVRAQERCEALRTLGLADAKITRLRSPNGAVADVDPGELSDRFGGLVEDGTTLLVPSRYEVSADQRATHLAGLLAASVRGAPTWEYAVWSRIDSPVPTTGRTVLLGEALSSLKRRAVCCFRRLWTPGAAKSCVGVELNAEALIALTTSFETALVGNDVSDSRRCTRFIPGLGQMQQS
jgi:LmbE family N-acetylglucosaminyl deacetylase